MSVKNTIRECIIFLVYEDIKSKQCASKPGDEEQKLRELKSEIDLHLIRMVKLLINEPGTY